MASAVASDAMIARLKAINKDLLSFIAYSTPSLPLIPEQSCHPFQTKAATDSRAKLPPWQIAPGHLLEPPDAG